MHLSETCDAGRPRLITHVDTTPASAHEVTCTTAIHDALAATALAPAEHLVDSAYVSAATLVHGCDAHAITLVFPGPACAQCAARGACIQQRGRGGRTLVVHREAEHASLSAARTRMASAEGQALYALRAGVEGTLSQAVRAFGLRRSRYRGLPKTRVQPCAARRDGRGAQPRPRRGLA